MIFQQMLLMIAGFGNALLQFELRSANSFPFCPMMSLGLPGLSQPSICPALLALHRHGLSVFQFLVGVVPFFLWTPVLKYCRA